MGGRENRPTNKRYQVVDVADEDVLLALRNQLVQQARLKETLVQVAVPGGVPILFVLFGKWARGQRLEGVFDEAGKAGLHEGVDGQVVLPVLVEQPKCDFFRLEGVHEKEGHVHAVQGIEVFHLPHCHVQK